ncbi:MAG: hypothetical protein AB1916_07265 [Thermodesulfobacteriota bacterium]
MPHRPLLPGLVILLSATSPDPAAPPARSGFAAVRAGKATLPAPALFTAARPAAARRIEP